MARRLLIAGNWKMNKTVDESLELARALSQGLSRDDLDVLVCPTNLAVAPVADELAGSRVMVGAQNLYWEDKGAYTGEVSGPMIRAAGATHVLIGHSERREYYGETEKTVNLKLKAALKAGLIPVVCVGELIDERESGAAEGVLQSQLAGGLAGLDASAAAGIILAYEPVWAIGTGLTATNEQAAETHGFIRSWMKSRFNKKVAESLIILYGGSVKSANAAGLLGQTEVDGALVGGASLTEDDFLGIIGAL